jgi:hypothetical protein
MMNVRMVVRKISIFLTWLVTLTLSTGTSAQRAKLDDADIRCTDQASCEILVGKRLYIDIASWSPGKLPICETPSFTQCRELRSGSFVVTSIAEIGGAHRRAFIVRTPDGKPGYVMIENAHLLSFSDKSAAKAAAKTKADTAQDGYVRCVEEKALAYAKSTEPADIVFTAAIEGCPAEKIKAASAILDTMPTSVRPRDIDEMFVKGLRGRILKLIIEARQKEPQK